MVAYNFKPQFVPLIESGKKTQTIRAIGKKRHAKPGERLQLYTGMRQPGCRKIIADPVCVSVANVRIKYDYSGLLPEPKITSGMYDINPYALAPDDGFSDVGAFMDFFEDTHGLPFEGVLIKWKANA